MMSLLSNPRYFFTEHPFLAAAVLVGAASVVGNAVFNCSTCGWDPHNAPWYEALLVAGVPFIVTPVGVIAAAVGVVVQRSKRALLSASVALLGLALPWFYWLGRLLVARWWPSLDVGVW
jgi:hypothetical protein